MFSRYQQRNVSPLRKTPLKAKKGLTTKKPLKGKKSPATRRKKSPLAKLKAKLWKECRRIIIKRYGNNCYTCPSRDLSGSSLHIGHFISSSICSVDLRYSLENLRPQCFACNIHRSGNWLAYERHLLHDGIDIEELKARNEATKGLQYREEWYEAKLAEYELL